MAWGRPFCMDPSGVIYFFGSRGGVYRMVPGQQPIRISQRINAALRDVDVGSTLIRMAWDDFCQGLYLFLTPLDATEETVNWFWDSRNDAWWPDVFGNTDHNPRAVHVYDGDSPDDRVLLMGGNDGYVRYSDPAALKDDGTAITSFVVMGPMCDTELNEFMLKDIQAVLGDDSGDVTWSIHAGQTAEAALNSTAIKSGSWFGGRNYLNPIRRSGFDIYVKLSSTVPWVLEVLRARYTTKGKVRRRGV
jgi:hypothetical protein